MLRVLPNTSLVVQTAANCNVRREQPSFSQRVTRTVMQIFELLHQCFWILKQKVSGNSDEEMLAIILKNNESELSFYTRSGVKAYSGNADLYVDRLMAQKGRALIYESAVAQIASKLDMNLMTRQDFLAQISGSLLKTFLGDFAQRGVVVKNFLESQKELTAQEFLEKIPYEALISTLQENDWHKIFNDPDSNRWTKFFSSYRKILDVRVCRMQHKRISALLQKFSSEERLGSGGWKMCVAQRLRSVDVAQLPPFVMEQFSNLTQGLAPSYFPLIATWQRGQDKIFNRTECQLQKWKIDLIGKKNSQGLVLNEIFQEKMHLAPMSGYIASRCDLTGAKMATEMGHITDNEVDHFFHWIYKLSIQIEKWNEYKDRLSERLFIAAYQEWGNWAVEVTAFEHALEELTQCATIRGTVSPQMSDEQLLIQCKRWKECSTNRGSFEQHLRNSQHVIAI